MTDNAPPRTLTRGILWAASWVVALPILGLVATAIGLVRAFDAIGDAPPETKANLLAQGISTSMNGVLVGAMLGAIGVPVLIILLVRQRRAKAPRGDQP